MTQIEHILHWKQKYMWTIDTPQMFSGIQAMQDCDLSKKEMSTKSNLNAPSFLPGDTSLLFCCAIQAEWLCGRAGKEKARVLDAAVTGIYGAVRWRRGSCIEGSPQKSVWGLRAGQWWRLARVRSGKPPQGSARVPVQDWELGGIPEVRCTIPVERPPWAT